MAHNFRTYTVRIYKRGENDALPIGNFDNSGSDALNFLAERLKTFQYIATDKSGNEDPQGISASTTEFRNDSDRSLSAYITFGKGGERFDAKDSTAPGAPVEITPQHRLERRCIALLFLPRNSLEGLLVSHLADGRGVKTQLDPWLKKAIPDNQFRIEVDPIIDSNAADEALAKAVPKELIFYRTARSEEFDRLNGLTNAQQFKVKVSVKPVKDVWFPNVLEIVRKRFHDGELGLGGIVPDEVRFDCSIGGRLRKVVVQKQDTIFDRFSIDVTDELDNGDDGFPTYASLHNEAFDLAEGMLSQT